MKFIYLFCKQQKLLVHITFGKGRKLYHVHFLNTPDLVDSFVKNQPGLGWEYLFTQGKESFTNDSMATNKPLLARHAIWPRTVIGTIA